MLSNKVIKAINAEIKSLEALVKQLKANESNYDGVDNKAVIDRLNADIQDHKNILK